MASRLMFAMIIILTNLESAQTVMGGFASTTWFMTLGVLGLGAAITGSGLFYRLSLHLVRTVSAELSTGKSSPPGSWE